ncbi:MAG: FAD-binding oxidoreductase [Gammaproteobacteria bacterium]|nr:FAD-binding oxidoreductase [Gammaproteobacteria bacterium]MBT8109214.1 FAD-binding oxidoreductase [Gammaproteobacteria bacterium]NND48494.1 FAD-binding oxidoreductase [Woeseiaceae bacterium]NNL43916.1 FAD-binding oxidoreductase [Woeseiaceae bacterium]
MSDLLKRIAKISGPKGLITGADVRQRPADWMGQTQCNALAIVRPASTQELSQIMKICHALGQPVVAAGGLTGLVQGTSASADEIVISFERMAGIESIDPVGRTITVQTGAPMQKVQEAAEKQGLMFAVDLGARGSATIGGNIATNAGGNQVIRYGMMREHVLGVEVVLADGTVVSSMNTLLKNNTGYDLKQLFIGSEGTLGLVTRAVLRLAPRPKSDNTAMVAVSDFAALTDLFRHVSDNLGGSLTSFEVMWKEHYELVAVESGRHTPPLDAGEAFYVIIEVTGNDADIDTELFTRVLEQAIEAELISDAAIASSRSQRDAIWNIREDIEALGMALMPAAIFDISLPIRKMEVYVDRLRSSVHEAWGDEARLIIFGHLGDGNLHVVVSARPWSDEARQQAEKMVYEPLADIGGAVSAEHGIGLEKRDYLHLSRSKEEMALMRSLKTTLDPKSILNPGKIFAA